MMIARRKREAAALQADFDRMRRPAEPVVLPPKSPLDLPTEDKWALFVEQGTRNRRTWAKAERDALALKEADR